MYFRAIELTGFKSFADPTRLTLEPGVTAIVGPNGCGKSNILDALRWCLGEQSAKALRGAHMQDVIFNGSEQRAPMGMAEVTLAFDNSDGRLPLDFAEVQVTRRVYRSGESEYLINKAPCRLRDIQETFMDTGIGTNAYSLIGQGKIDLVLSSKPEDRRYLFEEAAGIIKYKTRKRIAMRKLESAAQNLLRLTDIINEVQRQMRSLKRQVNAAIRHRELTQALRDLEIRNAWLHHNELMGQIEDLRSRFATASKEYERAATTTEALDAELESLNLQRVDNERVLMARRDGEHQIDAEMERVENQIALMRKEIDFAQKRQEEALEEHTQFMARAENLALAQAELETQGADLVEEATLAESTLSEEQAAYNAAAAEVTEAEARLEELRAKVLEAATSRNRAETELESLATALHNLDERLKAIYSQQESGNFRHGTLSDELAEAERQQQRLAAELEGVSRARQENATAQQAQTERLRTLQQEWQTLRERKSSQEARLKSLIELRDSYEGFAAGVRAVMKAKQEGLAAAKGIIGPIGDLLSTREGFVQAIEAALGGNINNVVVEVADAAKAAIGFLKQQRAGRVTFLPLDTIRSGTRDDFDQLRGLPGVIGRAIDYIECEQRIMPAVQYLLFNTAVVETIDDAIRIARSESRYPRLVTLDGEVVSSAGAVTGGRVRNESQGLLGRSAEIKELGAEVKKAEKRVATLSEEAQQVTQALQDLERERRQLEQEESRLRQEAGKAGVVVARLSTELDNVGKTGKDLAQQRDALLEERKAVEERSAMAQERISTIQDADESQQRALLEAQQEAAHLRQALSTRGDALSDYRVKLAGLRQSAEELERNRAREGRASEEAAKEAARRLELIATLKEQEKAHAATIEDNLERIKALSETREEAHTKVLEAQREHDNLAKGIDAATKKLKELRDSLSTAQKEVHRLELELSQKEDRVVYFEQRIREEYGLALASLKEEEVGTDEYDEAEREKLIAEHRKDLQRLGSVNLMAIEEYEALEQRSDFLQAQHEDLHKAHDTLIEVVGRIDSTIREMFLETFNIVSECFKNYFRRLFNGGQARIYLVDEDDPLESGIEIEARPPGKKPQTISLLSGGEQAMTAIALLFSIFSAKPSPFCVLDEVDAPLDDANIGRFLALVSEFTHQSQFIIITHSKQTMASANALFGVTQQERGVSQLVSVRFEEVEEAETAA